MFNVVNLAIDCGALAVPRNGSLEGAKTVYPNILKFTCDQGFDIIGSFVRECLWNGSWSGMHPKCQGYSISVTQMFYCK